MAPRQQEAYYSLSKEDKEAINKIKTESEEQAVRARVEYYKSEITRIKENSLSSPEDQKTLWDASNFARALAEMKRLRQQNRDIYIEQSRELQDLLGENVQAMIEVKQESIQAREVVSNELQEKHTDYHNSTWESNLARGSFDRYSEIQKLSATSKESLYAILRSSIFPNNIENLLSLVPKNETFRYFAGVNNYGAFTKELRDLGYRPTRAFTDREAFAVYQTLVDYKNNQEKISTLTDEKKISILLDNWDGLLSVNNWELQNAFQTLWAVRFAGGNGISNLIANLWLEDDFLDYTSKNLFVARETFQRRLEHAIKLGYNITDLTTSSEKISETSRSILERWFEIEREVKNQIDAYLVSEIDGNLAHLPNETKQQFKEEFKNKFDLSGLYISYLNGTAWLSTSMNIREFTKGILDNINFGISDEGKIWLSVSRWFFREGLSKYWTSVVAWLSATLSPFIGVSQRFKWDSYTPTELFEVTREASITASWSASFSSGAKVLSLNLQRVSENTSAGIENMISGMKNLLDDVGGQILGWVESYDKWENIPTLQEKEAYRDLKNAFEIQASGLTGEDRNQFMKYFLESAAAAYRDELYRKAAGWARLTSLGVGVLSIAWFHNLPFLTLGWEKISTRMIEVDRWDVERQRVHSETPIDLSTLGAQLDNDTRALSLPLSFQSQFVNGWTWKMQISQSPESTAQIKVDWDKVSIGWVWVDSIKVVDSTYGWNLVRTLVVDGWNKDDTGKYFNDFTPTDRINKPFETKTSGQIQEALQALERDVPLQTQVLPIISKVFTYEAIGDQRTVWVQALQKQFFDYRTQWWSLETVWNQYIKVIEHAWFKDFAKTKDVDIAQLISISKSISDPQKQLYVLQEVSMALTSKSGLILNAATNNYEVAGDKDINQYNTENNRDAYFDTMMNQEIGSLAPQIKEARNEWNRKYGTLKRYPKYTRTRWLALSGSQVGRQTGLTPISDSYDLIGDEKNGLIPLQNLDSDQKQALINKIPRYVLEGYVRQLNLHGVNIENLDIKRVLTEWTDLTTDDGRKVTLDFKTHFAKNAQCINDAIIIDVDITIDGKAQELIVWAAADSTVFVQANDVKNFGVLVGWNLRERKDPEPTEEPPTEEPPTTTPTEIEVPTETPPTTAPTEIDWGGDNPTEGPTVQPTDDNDF